MTLTLVKAELQALLAAPAAAALQRSTMPILCSLHISRSAGQLQITGSDLTIQISSNAASAGEDFSLTADAQKLLAITKAAPPGDIRLTLKDGRLNIKAGSSRYTLPTLPAPDFPQIKTAAAPDVVGQVEQGRLRQLLASLQYAMAVNDVRYFLCGMLLEISDKQIRAVATDGTRLSTDTIEADASQNISAILPRKAVEELSKKLGNGKAPVSLAFFGHKHLRISFDNIELCCVLIDARFPDWQRVIPRVEGERLDFQRQDLLDALERIEAVADRKNRIARLTLTPDSICLRIDNRDNISQDNISAAYSGAETIISFNAALLRDTLRNLPGNNVSAYITENNKAVRFHSTAAPGRQSVLMPYRY